MSGIVNDPSVEGYEAGRWNVEHRTVKVGLEGP